MSGEKCISWTKTIDLELIKEIKMRTGTTVNDVLSTCFAGSLRRYLRSDGMDNPADIQIIVTVNTRSPNILSRDNIPLENHSSGSRCTTFLLEWPILSSVCWKPSGEWTT
ncbi:hypothetical protein OS493_023000 [Desmophyllum pertusum]|uniref:Diacylglycerol O-acyltransferase n=1 Tax=Desmophyllum pertusum TaxID=174260 RepID=A0A9X0CWU1_9CNID|nr:hypothetical protein OS493_023000 [Desmophyllum pertusum]